MGICIHLAIAKSVTKEEWNSVYEETLKLIKELPLAERRTVNIDGIDTICLARTEEREFTYGWHDEKTRTGWAADGDYITMRSAEEYFLPRDLVMENEFRESCEDAMFSILPECLDYDWEDKRFDCTYDKWGAKTQGESYHIYLLAVACLIESRLGPKAFVYGDITRAQCMKAVEIANEYLENPIHVPDRCDMEKLFLRVDSMPLAKKEKLLAFIYLYLGNQDAAFGEFLRSHFRTQTSNAYWRKRFHNYKINQMGFREAFYDYLLWGYDLAALSSFVDLETEEGKPDYEKYIKEIMDAKLHQKEKDCSDPLRIDQDEPGLYSIWTQFADVFYGGAKNKKVDRYIPVEEIRRALKKSIGNYVDVDAVIDRYLEEEARQKKIDISKKMSTEEWNQAVDQDASEIMKQILNEKRKQMEDSEANYDISDYEDLMEYENGDTMPERLIDSIRSSFCFYNGLTGEERYKELMGSDPQKRCSYLIEQNRSVLIRDKDWKRIFEDIREHEESFERYYPMVRVQISSDGLDSLVKAIVLNDAFYEYGMLLVNSQPE